MKEIYGKWALITGASSGIGYDLAHLFAKAGCPLILTARRKERLNDAKRDLHNKYGVEVETISGDLSKASGARELFKAAQELGHPVSILVNNAGASFYGNFAEQNPEDHTALIQLNLTSSIELTRLFLDGMLERNEGWIMQVGSSFSFHPGPNCAVYAASKASLLSFSESLRHELRKTAVKHTILCPGATRTDFFEVSGTPESFLLNMTKMNSEDVAKIGFKAILKGKPYVISGIQNKFWIYGQKLFPRFLRLRIIDFLFKK